MENVKNFLKTYKYWILAALILAGVIIHAATDPRVRTQISTINQAEEEYEKELEAFMLEYSLPIEEEKAQAEWQAYRLEQRRLEEQRQKNFWGQPLETQENTGVDVTEPTTRQSEPTAQPTGETPQEILENNQAAE